MAFVKLLTLVSVVAALTIANDSPSFLTNQVLQELKSVKLEMDQMRNNYEVSSILRSIHKKQKRTWKFPFTVAVFSLIFSACSVIFLAFIFLSWHHLLARIRADGHPLKDLSFTIFIHVLPDKDNSLRRDSCRTNDWKGGSAQGGSV